LATIGDTAKLDESVKSDDGDFVVIICDKLSITGTDWIQDLLRDAARPDIGYVQARLPQPGYLAENIRLLLGPARAALINRQTRRNVAKHLYATARYNVPSVMNAGVFMVEKKKLGGIAVGGENLDVPGYRNLYNPYVIVVR
jgi:hypothetical protein